jgi:hypothetical protein
MARKKPRASNLSTSYKPLRQREIPTVDENVDGPRHLLCSNPRYASTVGRIRRVGPGSLL